MIEWRLAHPRTIARPAQGPEGSWQLRIGLTLHAAQLVPTAARRRS